MSRIVTFDSAEGAEAAFYRSFERSNLEDMMAVWATRPDIVCIHPLGPRLVGPDSIRASWVEIFHGNPSRRFTIEVAAKYAAERQLVSIVAEVISVPETGEQYAPVFATNVYQRLDDGWSMTLHHASPGAIRVVTEPAVPANPTRH